MKKYKKNNIGKRIVTGVAVKRKLLGPEVVTEFDRKILEESTGFDKNYIIRQMKKAKKQK